MDVSTTTPENDMMPQATTEVTRRASKVRLNSNVTLLGDVHAAVDRYALTGRVAAQVRAQPDDSAGDVLRLG